MLSTLRLYGALKGNGQTIVNCRGYAPTLPMIATPQGVNSYPIRGKYVAE
jgi:hypothetical protein